MTKIAVSALDANGLDAQISPHFGRCPYFIVVDVEGTEVQTVEAVANPFYANHQPGEVPGFVNTLGVQVMLSGGMGGRAVAFFKQFGIEPATGASGTVGESLARYFGGELSGAAPCSESVEHGHSH
jgi:predicted Fe-Mo cluster-binding NifX family protein